MTFLVSNIGISQPIQESVNYINYTIKDGLPSNETYDVFQDSKGFIWIGTDNGVVKYDGKEFKTYTTRDGLTDNTIFRIQEDYKGRIWFMTYNRRLCYLENGHFIEYKFNDIIQNTIKELNLTFTITDFHLDLLDNLHITLVNLSTLVISSNGKVINSSLKSNKFYEIEQPNIEATIKSVINGLNRQNKVIINSTKSDKIHLVKTNSKLYVGIEKRLFTLNPVTGKLIEFPLANYYMTGVHQDFEGGIWISTLSHGIIYIPNPQLIQFLISNAKNKHIYAIVPQSNHLVFCYGQHSNFYKLAPPYKSLKSSTEKLQYRLIPSQRIKHGLKFENPTQIEGIIKMVKTVLQIDTTTYLFTSIPGFFKVTTKQSLVDSVKKALHSRKRIKNLIYNQNTFHYTSSKYYGIIIPYNETTTRIFKTFKDSHDTIWLGTINGLWYFDDKTNTIIKKSVSKEFDHFRIQDIVETRNRDFFFATKANGVFIYNDGKLDSLTTNSGLLSNTVNQLIYNQQNNSIIAGTNHGISTISLNRKNQWVSNTRVSKYDAIKNTDIRQIIIKDSTLFFAHNEGIGKIHVDDLNDSLPPPLLHIQSLSINERSKYIDSTISLTYDSNNIQINYHAISYKSQNDIVYKYKLLPVNESWQTTTNNNLVFNTLIPDEYTLQLKAINIDGVESEVKALKFSIIPAFWMTWWFKGIVIILAVFLGYKLSIKTIQTYKSQAQFQRTINEMQIVSLQSKMNPHFIFNSLNSIQNYILKNEKANANQYLLEFSKLIRTILQNSDSPTILLKEELDTLLMYVDLEKKRIRSDFKYTYNIDPKIDLKQCIIPSLLVQPYIENAIWHGKVYSNPNGEIILNISKKDNTLYFEITDNGIGIKNAEASKIKKTGHKSLGTSVTKKRIELLSELNNEMSDVTVSEAFTNKETFIGTKISFNIPYILK